MSAHSVIGPIQVGRPNLSFRRRRDERAQRPENTPDAPFVDIQVVAAGIDTWSFCWYVERDSELATTMRRNATRPISRCWQLPQAIGGYRVGWFPDSGLLFAEGRARPDGLCAAPQVSDAVEDLRTALEASGIGPVPLSDLRLRRLDIAVDLRSAACVDGLSILRQAAATEGGKVGVYRDEHCVETVVLMTPSGRTKARIYDKGRQTRTDQRGRWLRFEAQWMFSRGSRPLPSALGPDDLRERFASRFKIYWGSPPRAVPPGSDPIIHRVAEAIERGELLPSRARSLVGYLYLTEAGLMQGARRTVAELEHECREHGLSFEVSEGDGEPLNLRQVFEECLKLDVWS